MEWGNQQQILMNNPSELFSGLIKGEYFFRVTDKNDCIYEEYIFVDQPDTIEVDVDITEVSCFGGDDGAIDLTPSGGTLSYNYTWSNTSTSEDQVNLTSQEYSYVLTDSNGCIYKQTLFVDQAPEIQIGQEIVPLSCIDQTDAEIHIATVGGTKPYEWQWSNGNETEHNTDLIAGQYNVIITDDYNCQKSYDFIITPSLVECVQVVNSFTPNGDNYNDTWIIENLYLYPNAEVRVFNRWGSLLFESIGTYSPWDGVYKGQALPSEVYYYIIRLNNGIDNQYTGTVTIVR
jgi:gliding motility-associated-like protein